MQGCNACSNPKLLAPHLGPCRGSEAVPAAEITPDLHPCALLADFYGVSAIAVCIFFTCCSCSFVRGSSPIHQFHFRLRWIKTKDFSLPTTSHRFLENWRKLQENESHLDFATKQNGPCTQVWLQATESDNTMQILFPDLEYISQGTAFRTIPANKG